MQFITTLAGHNFRPAEAKAQLAFIAEGMAHTLRIERDPENPYDSFAIKIIADTGNADTGPIEEFIGFVESAVARDLAPIMDAEDGLISPGHTPEVIDVRIIDWVSGPKKPTILIEITTGWEVDTTVDDDSADDLDDEDAEDGED